MSVPTNLNQFGDTTAVFGLQDLASLKAAIGDIIIVETAKYDQKPEVDEKLEGEVGEVVSIARSKPERWTKTVTIDGVVKDVAAYNALTEFTFAGRFWTVPEGSRSDANKQWSRITITAETFIQITS